MRISIRAKVSIMLVKDLQSALFLIFFFFAPIKNVSSVFISNETRRRRRRGKSSYMGY